MARGTPFEKGRAKTGGRQKGTPNKTTSLRQALEAKKFDFIAKLLEALDTQPPYQQVDTLTAMLPYMYVKPSGEDEDGNALFVIKRLNGELHGLGVVKKDD